MKRFSKEARTLLAIAAMMTAPSGFSHARLKPGNPLALRNTDPGNKVAPCGPATARNPNPTYIKPGATVTVQFEETIQHPGRFIFSFSQANDQNMQQLMVVPDNQDDPNNLPHQYSVTLTMPNIECEACTIQMIQVMTENPNNPTNYYSCADIKLTNLPQPPPVTPSPSPSSTPTASPSAEPKESTVPKPESSAPQAPSPSPSPAKGLEDKAKNSGDATKSPDDC